MEFLIDLILFCLLLVTYCSPERPSTNNFKEDKEIVTISILNIISLIVNIVLIVVLIVYNFQGLYLQADYLLQGVKTNFLGIIGLNIPPEQEDTKKTKINPGQPESKLSTLKE